MRECKADEFEEFLRAHRTVIVKPRRGSCGKGVRKIMIDCQDDIGRWYSKIYTEDVIVQEYLNQHPEMSAYHSESVNTIRITTVLTNNGLRIMNAALRMGNRGEVIDNHAAGGMLAAVDPETGIVFTPGVDKFSQRYIKHPVTQRMIVGTRIPYWDEVKKLARELALCVPEVRMLGET